MAAQERGHHGKASMVQPVRARSSEPRGRRSSFWADAASDRENSPAGLPWSTDTGVQLGGVLEQCSRGRRNPSQPCDGPVSVAPVLGGALPGQESHRDRIDLGSYGCCSARTDRPVDVVSHRPAIRGRSPVPSRPSCRRESPASQSLFRWSTCSAGSRCGS